jgi:transcription elongation factor SPT5
VQKYSLKVIDTRSEVKRAAVSEVTKLSHLRPQGLDSKRNPISKDDTVKIINGPYKNKRGVIKNIFKNFVFLYNQDFVSTNGIFVDKSENLEIMGSELLADSYNLNGAKVNLRKVPEELRQYVGKLVRIIRGNWKGHMGILKRVSDKNAAIELTSKNKIITIDIGSIAPAEDSYGNMNRGDNYMATPYSNNGGKTPAYFGQSPGYAINPMSPWNPVATRNI